MATFKGKGVRPAPTAQRDVRRSPTIGPGAQAHGGVPALGRVRRSQVISTYAIGAIIDLESGSFMPLGLEDWEQQTRSARLSSMEIWEARLQAQLGVRVFRSAPIVEEIPGQRDRVNHAYSVPAVRFPKWQECPKCHRLGIENDPFALNSDGKKLECQACGGISVNPVRFVVACHRGHIEDFPWELWAHYRRENGTCNAPTLFLESMGRSASLADLRVKCRNCHSSRSIFDAFHGEGLRALKCRGSRPWLIDHEPCDEQVQTLQRGASNIHFAVPASVLSIPPVSEPVFQALDEHWSVYRDLPQETLPNVLRGVADRLQISVEDLVAAFQQRLAIESGGPGYSEAGSRAEEYMALGQSNSASALGGYAPEFENTVSPAPPSLRPWFDVIGAVSRLREVRAVAGFSRISPYPVAGEQILEALRNGDISPLSKTPRDWFPAAEIRGEGIFLRFDTAAVDDWIQAAAAAATRAKALDRVAERMAHDRGYKRQYAITARLLLVHSFAHAMIRQLSLDCGYSASALRERLFVAEPAPGRPAMNGVLIYTGTPDSEGSLGGLVRLARPNLIADEIRRALHSAQWCGSDPVCLETDPNQSGERISGAACHCCLLVPETACEKFNRELDRTMLVGAPERAWKGYFSALLEQSA